jgi:hypothetical protein
MQEISMQQQDSLPSVFSLRMYSEYFSEYKYRNTHTILLNQEPVFSFKGLGKTHQEVNSKSRAAAIALQIPVV